MNTPTEEALRAALAKPDCPTVALPKTIPLRHSEDMLVDGNAITEWLRQQILADLSNYTCDATGALLMIERGDDNWIEVLKRVYKGRFDERITEPLRKLL